MMLRVKLSRWLNASLFGGNPKLMLSSRAYLEHRVVCMALIDSLFYLLRGETNHCRNSFYFDLYGIEMEGDP